MVRRYPHTAEVTLQGDMTYDPNTGLTTPGTPGTFTLPCRFEPSGGGRWVNTPDGNRVEQKGRIYTPASIALTLKAGDEITVQGVTFRIIALHKFQTYTVIWV